MKLFEKRNIIFFKTVDMFVTLVFSKSPKTGFSFEGGAGMTGNRIAMVYVLFIIFGSMYLSQNNDVTISN